MIGGEDDLEGGEDNERGGSRKPRKDKKRKKSDRDVVGWLQSIMMIMELLKCLTAVVEDMKVGDPEGNSRAGHTNGESCDVGMAVLITPSGLKIPQEQNVYL